MTSFAQRSPTLEEVIRTGLEARLMDLHVALPARVDRYDAAKQVIDAKPLIKRSFVTGDNQDVVETLPVIPEVPVMFPRAGGFFFTLPILVGDFVLLVFNERSIDNYVEGPGQDVDPVDLRMHNLTDAVAYPGFFPFSRAIAGGANTQNAVIGFETGKQVHFKQAEIALGSENPPDFVALASKVLTELQALQAQVNTFIGLFQAHIHVGVVPGPQGTVGITPTLVPTITAPKPVASAIVRTE